MWNVFVKCNTDKVVFDLTACLSFSLVPSERPAVHTQPVHDRPVQVLREPVRRDAVQPRVSPAATATPRHAGLRLLCYAPPTRMPRPLARPCARHSALALALRQNAPPSCLSGEKLRSEDQAQGWRIWAIGVIKKALRPVHSKNYNYADYITMTITVTIAITSAGTM